METMKFRKLPRPAPLPKNYVVSRVFKEIGRADEISKYGIISIILKKNC
jgi:hypothetical protein